MHFRFALVSVGAILCFMGTAFAQDPRGSIRGRVVDSSNSFVPGAAVSAVNAVTGIRAAAQTNQEGMYSIPFLPPGLYTVTAELSGFSPWSRGGVQVRVSETTELNITVSIGGVSERVEVAAGTPLLDTASASLGQVMDSRRIQELPIAAGNALELTLLTPGMIEPSKFAWKPAFNFRNIAGDGNPSFTTEYQIDGVPNTFAEGNAGRNRYAFAPPTAAISEFKMQTTPYDASIGHAMSSLVNVSTASGTNTLHGETYWFAKNSTFDAANFFNNKNATQKPKYKDNRYGASVGGPVIIPGLYNGRNKTFFHYVWEANKWTVPQTFTGTVPTEAQRRGDFSQLLALGQNYQIYDPATIQNVRRRAHQPSTVSEQRHPTGPPRRGGREPRQSLSAAQPPRHRRRPQQLLQRRSTPWRTTTCTWLASITRGARTIARSSGSTMTSGRRTRTIGSATTSTASS